jgi:hypothetical protein
MVHRNYTRPAFLLKVRHFAEHRARFFPHFDLLFNDFRMESRLPYSFTTVFVGRRTNK